jgi:type I restriction enzyme M protein
MILVMIMPAKNPALQQMREILDTKYFYKTEYFDYRTQYILLGSDPAFDENALCFEVYPGVPFCLFVATESNPPKKIRDEALSHALATETIGTVAFFSHDTEDFEVLRRHYRDNKFETVYGVEYYYKGSAGRELRLFEEVAEYQDSNIAQTPNLIPITNKLENIFFEIHSAMRDIDGLHADTALEELCKLLYLKAYLEEQESILPVSRVSTISFGAIEEYASCLRALYREAINYDLRVFRLKIPEYERSRGVFNLPIFLSSSALVKSFQLIEEFSLTRSDMDLKGRAFQKVLSKSVRSGMGQYFTPAQVCQLMVEIAAPTSSELILDPFCGSGHFLTESLSYVRRTVPDHTKEYHEFAFGKLHGIEKSDRMTRIAMTDMRLNGDGHSNIRCTDALLDFRNYPDLRPESFDLVLTNPPFGSILGVEAFSSLAEFALAQGRKKVPLEIAGLERSIQFLRPGGRIAIVLPESIFNAESLKYVREWLMSKLAIRIVIDLPNETFAPFGANVRSGILMGRKLRTGEGTTKNHKVCMIKIDNLGYDAAGRETKNPEIAEAIKIAKRFLQKEGW